MMLCGVTVLLLTSCLGQLTAGQSVEDLQAQVADLQDRLDDITNSFADLSRQTMVQGFMAEEKVRADGDSGIIKSRGNLKGPENYYASNHILGGYMAIHDHTNYARTIGMGDFSAVLNGVSFRTRHNDYKMKMPSPTSTDYHATEDVPFPTVPEAVTELSGVKAQAAEMKEWFRAFATQNTTHRDYRDHFKPVLCYLEGTWTISNKQIDESFESDRHNLDASTWFELMNNVRYSAYTGTKNRLENFAVLPTTIMSVNETTGKPNLAQWNYRIMCNPLKEDVPLKYLKQADDLAYRFPRNRDKKETLFTRAARFKLYEYDSPKFTKYSMIDRLMGTIPGKDNGLADLSETSFNDVLYNFNDPNEKLNAGFYHRWFKFQENGANGLSSVSRGYNDENCWVAKTSQKNVAPMSFETCNKKGNDCQTFSTRVSFAVPLEIIYTTPLLSWNPYNLQMHPKNEDSKKEGGKGTKDKPLNGVDPSNYYMTPLEFFTDPTTIVDPADTVKKFNYVLNKKGETKETVASGNWILLQNIEGIGQVRLRYPIAPLHGEGSSVWKELNALRDLVFTEGVTGKQHGGNNGNDEEDDLPAIMYFETAMTNKPTQHFHSFSLSKDEVLALKAKPGSQLTVTTSTAAGHSHDLVIRYNFKRDWFEYARCDGEVKCWDKHARKLIQLIEQNV